MGLGDLHHELVAIILTMISSPKDYISALLSSGIFGRCPSVDHGSIRKKFLTYVKDTKGDIIREYHVLPNKKKEGPYTLSLSNGQVYKKGEFRDGLKEGVWKLYHLGEEKSLAGVWEEITYVNDKIEGVVYVWTVNGVLIYENAYVNGEKHGEYMLRYSDGSPKEKGSWCRGQREGEWNYWLRDGYASTETYKNGKLVS